MHVEGTYQMLRHRGSIVGMYCSSPKEVELAEAADDEEDAALVVVVSRTAVSIAANRQVTTVGLLACRMVSA